MKRWLTALSMLVVLVSAAAVLIGYQWLQRPLTLATDKVAVSIKAGASPRDAANAWVNAGVQTPNWLLYEWFRWSGDARRIRAGSYEINRQTSPRALMDLMVRGNDVTATVRLVEGWTLRQFRAELARTEGLKAVTTTMTDDQLMDAVGSKGTPAEGQFYPDTYSYSVGSTDLDLLRRAHRAMQTQLDAAWAERAPNSPLRTPQEALTLASIVEKETGLAIDRGKVAAVFVNRLRLGMLLQTDPTVIYGMGAAFDGNLRRRDLSVDTPFNTYVRVGLPPTPIAMPSRAALFAAVKPEPISALYFVARGDGTSEFTADLAAHNRAVNRFQRGR
jgi:UPF0755 protein